MPPESAPRGHLLVELVIAMVLLTCLTTGCVTLLAVQLRQVRTIVSTVEAGSATRFASRLLRSELRPVAPALDVSGVGPDSSRQRVFRGMAISCATSGKVAEVRYRGLRDPDPTKDSMVVMLSGGEAAVAVTAVRPPAIPTCAAAPGEKVIELATSDSVPAPALLLLFERGTWHLSGSALRYSRGRGGRQPITAAVFVDDSTHFTSFGGLATPAAIGLVLAARPNGSTAMSGLLRVSDRIALLNLPFPLDSVLSLP